MISDNDTVIITNQEAAWMERWMSSDLAMKCHQSLGPYGSMITRSEGHLLFQELSSRIDNASSTITLADNNTAIEGISLPQGNITGTEGIYTTATITNENNDSSQILGENAVVVEGTTTE
ncbi:MAG: hypothetical protein LN568_06770 [Rickettsia endosymbiont of Pseudomimeciton antennatum]|nr:hypothetical protein [Rickettsia endosymbiont of Pseudomimeciton antennatum]